MKHIVRLLVVVLLFSLTVSVAAYRTNPEVSPQLAEQASLSETFTLPEILSQAAVGLGESIENAAQDLGESVAQTVVGSVASVEESGEYTADGRELLNIELSSATVPVIRSAMSEQMGGMVTTEDLIAQLNSTADVTATQNEDGSVSLKVPEDLYAQYTEMFSFALGE